MNTKNMIKSVKKGFTLIELLIVIAIIAIVSGTAVPTGCFVPKEKAIAALETQGFSHVEIVDRDVWFVSWKGGDKSDAVRFTATATNPAGRRVTVYIYSGWLFKGATIRTP